MSFLTRIKGSAEAKNSRIVLALDFNITDIDAVYNTIELLAEHICSIKLNMHLILPLAIDTLRSINDYAHSKGLQSIADIKLNDIPSTNMNAIEHLYRAAFDAITLNPIIGYDALHDTISYLHSKDMGAIALVYMSHASAESTYGMKIEYDHKGFTVDKLYMLFLTWAVECNADGIVVGATRPNIIKECRDYIAKRYVNADQKKSLDTVTAIFSPGIDVQGGDARDAIVNGTEYVIVGRSIINAQDPLAKIIKLKKAINESIDHLDNMQFKR
jgi:orotidine-5'-phosphate decarboxylase